MESRNPRSAPPRRPTARHLALILTTLLTGSVMSAPTPDYISAFPVGEPNVAYAQYFTGNSHLARLTQAHAKTGVPIANVTFEPGCRNNWHRHTGGQILVCLAGQGLYQERGKPARHLKQGDIVEIPADTDHWHGATATHWFAHLSIECHPETNKNTWLEPVDDAAYAAAQPATTAPAALDAKSAALVRYAGAAAAGNLVGLAKYTEAALDAGWTINELKEVALQLYAYAGFPRCLNTYGTLNATLKARAERGITDVVGAQPNAPLTDANRERVGRETRATLAKTDPNAPEAEWQTFAPGAEQCLKEHLFGDLFARGILTHAQRELATVAFLSAIEAVDPQLAAHKRMASNTGWTAEQLEEATRLAREAR